MLLLSFSLPLLLLQLLLLVGALSTVNETVNGFAIQNLFFELMLL